MLLLFFLTILIFFLLIIAICKNIHTNKKLKAIKVKNEEFYHDLNSSLVVFKLTLESLNDFSLEIRTSKLTSLLTLLDENICNIEESFSHWSL